MNPVTAKMSPCWWRLPEVSEQQASQGGTADGETHGDDAIPEAELPGGHVVIQQEKRKHGHCTLLTCIQEDEREVDRLKERKQSEKREDGSKQTGR